MTKQEIEEELNKMQDFSTPKAHKLMDKWAELNEEDERKQEKINVMGVDFYD